MMKKILAIFLVFACLFTSACTDCTGNKEPSDSSTTRPTNPAEEIKETDIVFAENGVTDFKIVIPENAGEAITDADLKLRSVFNDATGATLTTVSDSAKGLNENEAVISLGETQILKDAVTANKIGVELTHDSLNRHGYVIKRLGKTVVIAGAVDEGVYYGVLELLNRQFHYETYAADEISFDKVNKSLLLDYNLIDIPSFAGRDIDGYTDFYATYAKDLRLTRNFGAVKQIPGDCHTLYRFFENPAETGEDGQYLYFESTAESSRPCITNVNTVNEAVRMAKKILIQTPDADFLNLAEEDMQAYCRGQAHKEADGSSTCTCASDFSKYRTSGVWIRFVNKVIAAIEEWRKDPISDYEKDTTAATAVEITPAQAEAIKNGHWKYTTFTYGGSFIAPTTIDENGNTAPIDKTVIPHEKLYMKFAPLDIMCVDHAFNDEDCTTNKQNVINQMKNWKAICNNYNTWSYWGNYRDYLMYIPHTNTVQENARVYKELGVYNYFTQSHTLQKYSSMYALNYYLYAKTAWNVDADLAKLIGNFMTNYYKDAAEVMTGYVDYMNTWCAVKQLHHGNYTNFDADFFPRAVLEKAMDYINQAFAAIEHYKTDDPALYNKLYTRILFEKICTRYMLLKGYDTYYSPATVEKQGLIWLKEMKEDVALIGNFQYAELYTKTMEQACLDFETALRGML